MKEKNHINKLVPEELAMQLMNSGESLFLANGTFNDRMRIIDNFKRCNVQQNILYVAADDLIACKLGIENIYSFLQFADNKIFPSSIYVNYQEKQDILRHADCIIIPELTVVQDDFLLLLNYVLKALHNVNTPFGGVQIIISGNMESHSNVMDTCFMEEGMKTLYPNNDVFRTAASIATFFRVVELYGKDVDCSKSLLQSEKTSKNHNTVDGISCNDKTFLICQESSFAANIHNSILDKYGIQKYVFDATVTGKVAPDFNLESRELILGVGASVISQIITCPDQSNAEYITGIQSKIGCMLAIQGSDIVVDIDGTPFVIAQKEYDFIEYKLTKFRDAIVSLPVHSGKICQYPLLSGYAISKDSFRQLGLDINKISFSID